MKLSDRRLARRFNLTIPVYIRGWKSRALEQKVESVNVSECGVYFETDAPPHQGAMIEVRLEMPTEITGHPVNEWRCAGKVVRIHSPSSTGDIRGVSVRFDYYEVARNAGLLAASSMLQDL